MDILEEYLNDIQQEIAPAILAAGAIAGIINAINMSVKVYKDYLTKNRRRCSDLPEAEQALCLLKVKSMAKQQQMKKLQQVASKCKQSKNPDKCMEKVQNKIQNVKHDAQMFAKRADQLKHKVGGK